MLLFDHKMAQGAIKSSCGDADLALDSDIQYFQEEDGDSVDEASELVDIFKYGDTEDTIGQDNLLMSYTHSYMKKRGEVDSGRSKSIGTSVSKAFTDALTKLEEISHDSRNKQFHKLFPEVPEDEVVVNTYSCALCREILLHGRMFVSQNWICFHSNIFTYETQVVIRVSSIVAITKERTAIVVPNAIGIVTQDEKHVFGSLLSRHATHKQLMKVWRGTSGTEDEDHSSSPASEDTDSECLDLYLPQKSEVSVDSTEMIAMNGMDEEDMPVPEDLNGGDDGVPRKRAASYRRKSSIEREESLNSNENCSKMSKVVCAMSVFKSLLRIFSSLKDASHTQIFLGLTIILLICLTTSALVLRYRISKLEPQMHQDATWADINSPTPESFEGGFWSKQVNHKQKVAQIQDALSSQLESLSRIHSSLQLLHHSTFLDKDQKDANIPNESKESHDES
ncbi:uncharacterized protein [Amphiura filiformis]|uniref:uncharacterized protein isoform X2 n=1 Tax=Amphiura filiformis TaxID=82378 RepID=UPI003B20F41A